MHKFFANAVRASQKDPLWAAAFTAQVDEAARRGESDGVLLAIPPGKTFKPDDIISLADTVAVFDWTYIKRASTFTLIGPGGKQQLFQARDAADMNDWIAAMCVPTLAADNEADPRIQQLCFELQNHGCQDAQAVVSSSADSQHLSHSACINRNEGLNRYYCLSRLGCIS